MASNRVSLRSLVRQVGNSHEEFNEILRRIRSAVMDSDEDTIVISQVVGTFYKQRRRETRRVLNGVEYVLPAREVLQLRPPAGDGDPVPPEPPSLSASTPFLRTADVFRGEESLSNIVNLPDEPFEIVSVSIREGSCFSPFLTIGGVQFSDDDFVDSASTFAGQTKRQTVRRIDGVEFRDLGNRIGVVIQGDHGVDLSLNLDFGEFVNFQIFVRFLEDEEK